MKNKIKDNKTKSIENKCKLINLINKNQCTLI